MGGPYIHRTEIELGLNMSSGDVIDEPGDVIDGPGDVIDGESVVTICLAGIAIKRFKPIIISSEDISANEVGREGKMEWDRRQKGMFEMGQDGVGWATKWRDYGGCDVIYRRDRERQGYIDRDRDR